MGYVEVKWSGEDLKNLLEFSVDELLIMYPNKTRNYLRTIKKYHERKAVEKEPSQENKFEDILRLHNMSPELAQEFKEQGFHVGYIKNSEGEIEYTIPLPNAKKSSPTVDFEPAKEAHITPTRREAIKRAYNVIFCFSDAQIDYRRLPDETLLPVHNETAIKVAQMICRDLQPDYIINLGDTVDLASLSRFKPDSDHYHRTMGPSFQRVHDMYAQFRADNPQSRIIEVDSNHNTRLKDFILKNAPSMYGVKRAGEEDEYPVFSYPYLANLRPLDVEWISGYGAAEFVYGEEYNKPPIIFKHGTIVNKTSTSSKESSENPETHVVRGHSHRMESHYRTTRAGHYLGSFVVGALCKTTGEVPSYHSAVDDNGLPVKYQENWQSGVMVIEDYEGDYVFHHIPIQHDKAFYNGKEYTAE